MMRRIVKLGEATNDDHGTIVRLTGGPIERWTKI
jgi:hypothetical protein